LAWCGWMEADRRRRFIRELGSVPRVG
jgi:hypothetical protein